MTSLDEEAIEHYAHLTRLLLDHVHAPLTGGIFLRGVLPTPDAVRMVTGDGTAQTDATVTGMALVQVHTDTARPTGPTEGDRALRTLAWPFVETPPSPALCGFLFTGPDSYSGQSSKTA
ncbi:hypothetical protein AB0I69_32310 [Streptomyces sp. NPDC050508]|uniref:hypothetical protein n=1 Tax=Streptomyces sp. NPDC050508 TaxID=3155405 RepID=UPI003427882C